MKNTYLLLALSLASPQLLADTTSTESNSPPVEAIGLSLGWIEANGFSYRRYFGKQYIQGTFAAAIDKDVDDEYLDLSFSYARYLQVFEMKDAFLPIGLKIVAGSEVERKTDRSAAWINSSEDASPDAFHIGFGIGADIGNPLRSGFVVSLNAVYTATYRSLKTLEFVRLGLLPSASVHYNF